MMVEEIINNGELDFAKVDGCMDEEDRRLIRSVKIPATKTEDKPVWRGRKDGEFSAKRGYKAALETEKKREDNVASYSYTPSGELWKGLWGIKTIPKIINFLWRAVKGALATNEALYKKKCAKSPACPICKVNSESVEHLLFLCPWAKQ